MLNLRINLYKALIIIVKFKEFRMGCIMLILEKVKNMRKELREIFIHGCNEKIEKKGDSVGLSFYAFFKNKNDNPELLMEAANWWIMQHKLDHFEKAVKIKALVLSESSPNLT